MKLKNLTVDYIRNAGFTQIREISDVLRFKDLIFEIEEGRIKELTLEVDNNGSTYEKYVKDDRSFLYGSIKVKCKEEFLVVNYFDGNKIRIGVRDKIVKYYQRYCGD